MPVSGPITPSAAAQTATPAFHEMGDFIKYGLALSLPNFILKLASKFTGGELLTERYANRIFNQAATGIGGALQAKLGKEGGLLAGQSDKFFNDAGQAVVSMAKQFVAGHIKQEGWKHVDGFVDKMIEESVGKSFLAPVVKALSSPILNTLKTDLEKQLHVQSSDPNYISKTVETGRDALISLIEQYTVADDPRISPDNVQEKAALVASLKKAAISTLNSPALSHTLAQFVSSQLQGTQLGMVEKFVGTVLPNIHDFRTAIQTAKADYEAFLTLRDDNALPVSMQQIEGKAHFSALATLSDKEGLPDAKTLREAQTHLDALNALSGANTRALHDAQAHLAALTTKMPQRELMLGIWETTKAQLQAETSQKLAHAEADTPNLITSLGNISKAFLRDYLGENRWNLANDYANTTLSKLPPTFQPIGKEIWAGLKQDIQSYAQSTAGAENTVVQMGQLGQQFARGYLGKFGWDAVDQYVNTTLTANVAQEDMSPQTRLTVSIGQQLWAQVKENLQQTLKVDSADPHNDTFITDTLASGGKLLSTILGQAAVTEVVSKLAGKQVAITTGNIVEMTSTIGVGTAWATAGYETLGSLGYAIGYSSGSTVGGMIGRAVKTPISGLAERTTQTTVATVMQQLFAKSDVASTPSLFSLAGAITKGAGATQTGLINAAKSYLSGQGFTTLDKVVDQQVAQLVAKAPPDQALPATAVILPRVWEQIKSQLTSELFGSQKNFDAQYAENKDHPLSILIDMSLSKVLGVSQQHSTDKLNISKVAARLGYDLTKQIASGSLTRAKDQLNLASEFLTNYFNMPIENPEERAQMEALRIYFEGLKNLVIDDQTQPEDVIHIALAAFQSPDATEFGSLTERINAKVMQAELKAQLLEIAARLSPEQLKAFDTTNTYTTRDENGTTVHVNNRTAVLGVNTDQLNTIKHHLEERLALPATGTLGGHQAAADFVEDFRTLKLQLKSNNYSYTDVGTNFLRNFWNNDGLSANDRQTVTLLFNTAQRNEQLFAATTQFLNSSLAYDTVTEPIWQAFQVDSHAPVMELGNHYVQVTQTDPEVSYFVEDHGPLGVKVAIEARWQIESYGAKDSNERQSVPPNADNSVAATTYFYLRPSKEGRIDLVYNEEQGVDPVSNRNAQAVRTTIAATMNNEILFDSTRPVNIPAREHPLSAGPTE